MGRCVGVNVCAGRRMGREWMMSWVGEDTERRSTMRAASVRNEDGAGLFQLLLFSQQYVTQARICVYT